MQDRAKQNAAGALPLTATRAIHNARCTMQGILWGEGIKALCHDASTSQGPHLWHLPAEDMQGCSWLPALLCTVCKRLPVAEALQKALACHILLCVAMMQAQLGPHLCERPPGAPRCPE